MNRGWKILSIGARGLVRLGSSALGFGARSVVDFLVEDACVLCRRITAANEGAPPTPGYARHLLRPVECHWFGRISVTNHPVCTRCAAGFVQARNLGALGHVLGSATVVTPEGEIFGPLDDRASPNGPPRWIPIVSPFMTNDNALEIIRLVKFSGYTALIPSAADAMSAAYRHILEHPPADSVLVAVPMAAREVRRRGFNQALRLAEALGGRFGVAVVDGALRKIAQTARQSQTHPGNRADNVRDAFACSSHDISGKRVILVDDLITTGATAAACASPILGAGARDLHVVCFARAL